MRTKLLRTSRFVAGSLHRVNELLGQQIRHQTRRMLRYKLRYNRYSDRSQLRSHFYLCWMAIAPSMSWYMPMLTPKYP